MASKQLGIIADDFSILFEFIYITVAIITVFLSLNFIKEHEINLISDKHYSDNQSKNYLRRGYSLNKIRQSLIRKGIDRNEKT